MPDAQSTHDVSSRALSSFRQHRAEDVRAADHVHVEVHDFLPADPAGVGDEAEAVGGGVFPREPPRQREQPPERAGVLGAGGGERIDVLLRYQHEMHRRLRANVVKRQNLRVLVKLLRGHFSAHDLAEDALIHDRKYGTTASADRRGDARGGGGFFFPPPQPPPPPRRPSTPPPPPPRAPRAREQRTTGGRVP